MFNLTDGCDAQVLSGLSHLLKGDAKTDGAFVDFFGSVPLILFGILEPYPFPKPLDELVSRVFGELMLIASHDVF